MLQDIKKLKGKNMNTFCTWSRLLLLVRFVHGVSVEVFHWIC